MAKFTVREILDEDASRQLVSAKMSLEDVVRNCSNEEKHRGRGDGESESKQRHLSSMITELASSVKVVAARLDISQTVLTRCMARHAVCWLDEVLNVPDLSLAYNEVFLESKKGHTVIRKQMEQTNFESLFPYEAGDTWWDIPNFVSIRCGDWKEAVSADTHTILMYGMAWSLTTLRHKEWDVYNIETYFLPEVRHFEKMLAYRRVDLASFESKLKIDITFTPKS